MAISDTVSSIDNYYIGKGILYWKGPNDADYRDLGNVPTFELTPTLDKLDHFSSRQGVRVKDLTVVRQKSLAVRIVLEEITAKNLALGLMAQSDAAATNLVTTADFTSGSASGTIADASGLFPGRTYNISATSGGILVADETMVFNGGNAITLSDPALATNAGAAITITSPIAMTILSESDIRGAIKFEPANDVGAPIRFEIPIVSLTPDGAIPVINEEFGQITLTGDVYVDQYGNFGYAYWNV